MKIIAYTLNGNVEIAYITDDTSIGEYSSTHLSGIDDVIEITNTKFPDLYFRNAFEIKNGRIGVNLDKAKLLQLDRFRTARVPILASLDIEFMKAIESGDVTLQQQIHYKKQLLRDVTDTVFPNTLEGIKSTWPPILGMTPYN